MTARSVLVAAILLVAAPAWADILGAPDADDTLMVVLIVTVAGGFVWSLARPIRSWP